MADDPIDRDPPPDNVVAFQRRLASVRTSYPYLAADTDERLSAEAAEDFRRVLYKHIENASVRWARDERLLLVGERPLPTDSLVPSASETCARVALEEGIRYLFWGVGGPVAPADVPQRILELEEEFLAGLRSVLKDGGFL